jgi:hypothetical protein
MSPEAPKVSRDELVEMFTGDVLYRSEMAFYLDENVDQRIVQPLRDRGIRVTSVQAQGQMGETDVRVLARARKLGCVLVTWDNHFEGLHDLIVGLHETHGTAHAGIILVKSRRAGQSPVSVADALARLVEKYEGFADVLKNDILTLWG